MLARPADFEHQFCDLKISPISEAEVAPHPQNPRQGLHQPTLATLRSSISKFGILQPLIVYRADRKKARGIHYVLCGHRRLAVAHDLHWSSVPVKILSNIEEKEALLILATDNWFHPEPNPIDQALSLRILTDPEPRGCGMTNAEAAAACGLETGSAVSYVVKYPDHPPYVQQLLIEGRLAKTTPRIFNPYIGDPEIMSAIVEGLRLLTAKLGEDDKVIKRDDVERLVSEVLKYSNLTQSWSCVEFDERGGVARVNGSPLLVPLEPDELIVIQALAENEDGLIQQQLCEASGLSRAPKTLRDLVAKSEQWRSAIQLPGSGRRKGYRLSPRLR